MATHSSVLAWRIPGTGEPGGLPSVGSHRVGHDWSDLAVAAAVSSSEQSRVGTELLASYFLLKEKRRANPEPHAPRPALLEEHMGSRLGPFMAPKLKKNFEILVTALSLPSSLHFYFLSKVATVLALDNFSHSPYILQRFHSGPIIRISPHY